MNIPKFREATLSFLLNPFEKQAILLGRASSSWFVAMEDIGLLPCRTASLCLSSVAVSILDFCPMTKGQFSRKRLAGAAISAPENKDLRESRVVIVFTDDGGLALLKKRGYSGGTDVTS